MEDLSLYLTENEKQYLELNPKYHNIHEVEK